MYMPTNNDNAKSKYTTKTTFAKTRPYIKSK